jgi:hypothetical protein
MDGIDQQVSILNGEKSRKGDEAAAAQEAKDKAEAEANASSNLDDAKTTLLND